MEFYEGKSLDNYIPEKYVVLTDDCLNQIFNYLDNLKTQQANKYGETLNKFNPYCNSTLFKNNEIQHFVDALKFVNTRNFNNNLQSWYWYDKEVDDLNKVIKFFEQVYKNGNNLIAEGD